ncbi:MAG TPA: hypothetical protein VF384_19855 [Planctomycetota bacterium]
MLRSLFPGIVFSLVLPAQDPPAPPAAPLPVDVPTFANPTCPIMGKKVSMPLFLDTELGRFYVCCKPCYKKIAADLPAAHKTAYPVVQQVENDVCPVSGQPIGEDALAITLQGFRFKLCCSACVEEARSDSQLTLTKITRKVVDLGNEKCPVSGKPTAPNAFAVVGETIVRLSSPLLVDEVRKDPATVLEKARSLAKAQPAKPPHEHKKPDPKPVPDPARKDGGK